jgi:FKBP-type peptidyl-prolyl cis-trans isomerase FkpA
MGRGKSKGAGKGSKGQNRKNTESFLDKNRQKEGVKVFDSGLQMLILEKGDDHTLPDLNAQVTIHQRILLTDGTVIRDTYQENTPETFPLQEAIPGLKEGIPLMNKSGRSKFFVPPELAWGKRGAGDKIGPMATLIFDIRLIDFF